MTKEEFIKSITNLGIIYNDRMLEQLEIYADFLLEYNEHTNLTAIRQKEEVYLKHFYDSLTLVKAVDLTKVSSLLDIGSGAGFPGMVLKIFFPHLKITLIDANNKKTTFLKLLVDKLQVTNIDIINERVEVFAKSNLNSFAIVTARAVTNLPVLTELALPLVTKNGFFIAMKGIIQEELDLATEAIKVMGGKLLAKKEFSLMPNMGERTLIVIQKLKETNIKDLRPYEKIIKKPLQKKIK